MKTQSLATLVASYFAFSSGVNALKVVGRYGQCGGKDFEPAVCREGLICEELNEYWSHCVDPIDLEQTHLVDVENLSEHGLKKRQQSTAVTGAVGGAGNQRVNLQWLQTQRPSIFNMFLVGLWQMQQTAESNLLSYYEVAGIHGAPFKGWGVEGTPGNAPQMGYCTHVSALFATWHRPYLIFLEQRIQAHAIQIANRFTGSNRQAWINAATAVRLPYWDWSANDGRQGRMPDALTMPTIWVAVPGSTGNQINAPIANPLYSYRFTSTRKNNDFRIQRIRDAPYTVRQPPNDMRSSNMGAVNQAMMAGFNSRRTLTYNLFSITSFNQFSNRRFSGGNPSNFVSVESIHDEVHVAAGGNSGHMTFVEYSAFDPIFFIHHCNVDRLVAMYQAVRPGLVVQPQEMSPTFARPNFNPNVADTIDTPLNPFRASNGQLFTSRHFSSASSIWTWGYSYPEVPAGFMGRPADQLRTYTIGRINALYGPQGGARKRDIAVDREYILQAIFNTKDIPSDASLVVHLGNRTTSVIEEDPGFVCTVSAFTMAHGERGVDAVSSCSLSEDLREQGVSLEPKIAVRYLRKNLKWYLRSGGQEIDMTDGIEIAVSSAPVSTGPDGLRQFGTFRAHFEIGADKRGYIKENTRKGKMLGAAAAAKLLEGLQDTIKDIGGVLQGAAGAAQSAAASAVAGATTTPAAAGTPVATPATE